MNSPQNFTMHPGAQERADAEAAWLDKWCEEVEHGYRHKGKNPPW